MRTKELIQHIVRDLKGQGAESISVSTIAESIEFDWTMEWTKIGGLQAISKKYNVKISQIDVSRWVIDY